jgi:hypothetical protein
MAYVTHKEPKIGFALQTALGIPASTATDVFPLPEGTDFAPEWTYETYENNAGNYEETHYFISGFVAQGGLKIPLVPGFLMDADLCSWIFGDTEANLNAVGRTPVIQYPYATIWQYLGNGITRRYPNVKVTGGNLTIERGQPVYLTINPIGGTEPDAVGTIPAYGAADYWDGTPYHSDSAFIQLGAYGGAAAVDEYTRTHSLDFDNRLLDAGDAPRITYRRGPGFYAIPNTAGCKWTGSFSRDYIDTNFIVIAENPTYEGQYTLTMEQGASVGVLSFPRILYTNPAWPRLPGDGILQHDGINFAALGGLGSPGNASWTWSEA